VPYRLEEAGEVANFARAKWARRLASGRGVKGKEMTLFILEQIWRLTEGASLRANMALPANNARLGGEIACRLGLVPGRK
jgi:pseudouridine-5'-phosphate glycosidase